MALAPLRQACLTLVTALVTGIGHRHWSPALVSWPDNCPDNCPASGHDR